MSDTVTRLADDPGGDRAAAARDFGREPGSVTLIAVSKTLPAEAILPVLAAGQRVFGENYVQEAKAKWPALRERFPDVELHLIGPLQSNKAREAVELFDVDPVARPRRAWPKALAREIAPDRAGRRGCFVQVNTGEEPQKGGVLPARGRRVPRRAAATRHGLAIEGLMCIPPADEPPSPHFALLAKIAAPQRAQRACRWA